MQGKSNPLFVIINPPGIQYGMPGDIVQIHVVVINEGQQSAVIDLFFTFDETFEKISNWSSSPRASLAIAPKQTSDEVTFELKIPVDTLPGTYDYTFVVDSPEHYPQDTPISFPGQIKVLLLEQTTIRANDPTFSIQPATNPNKPLIYKPNQPLQVQVQVENRSTRVDRLHLTCPELDEDWFRISYPVTGAEAAGLLEVSALELNPMSQGQILLEFRPPANTLAGNYSPTIRLHSENNPDLVLLDLVYFHITTDYQLGIELNTILGTVSRNPGKYKLIFNNQGNLVRELFFSARSRDEEEFCLYKFEPGEVKILPNKNAEANLTIKPQPWWRRPWIGQPLIINFQVDVTDKQNLPITSPLPQGVLVWKARPWWQFLLLILLGFGLMAGMGFLIWTILNPEPLKIEEFKTDEVLIKEGDQVKLNWTILNYKQLQRLEVTTKQPPRNQPFFLVESQELNSTIKDKSKCESSELIPQEKWICNRFKTGISTPGKYTFEIKAYYNQRKSLFSQTIQTVTQTADVEIQERERAKILDVKTDKTQYKKEENVILQFSIEHPELLKKIEIATKKDDGIKLGSPIIIILKTGVNEDSKSKLKCDNNKISRCTLPIPIPASPAKILTYELTAYSIDDKISQKQTDKIEVKPKPFKIIYFKINGSEELNQNLNEGEDVTLSWQVEGENIKVELLPYGNVEQKGTKKITVTKNFTSITLQVTDISGEQLPQKKGFLINVKEIEPTPNPFISPLNPISPTPSPKQNPL